MYLVNETTGAFGISNLPQAGWRNATQEEIDEYLLEQAKLDKIEELKIDLQTFQIAGYEYAGDIVCAAWDSETTYDLHDLVLATDTKNYRSIQASNLNHEPPNAAWWEEFKPVFKTDDCCLVDLPVVTDDEFYCKAQSDGHRIKVNFGNSTNWNAFIAAMHTERDRIMKKYNAYQTQIADCSTVAEVEAISIDFSA
jgi:hypothetical protein